MNIITSGLPETGDTTTKVFFLTLTAPSYGKVHRAGHCHKTCPVGYHPNNDGTRARTLGAAVNPEDYDYAGSVAFNNQSGQLFGSLRRSIAHAFPNTNIQYTRLAEEQRRGLIHFHTLIVLRPGEENGYIPSEPEFMQTVNRMLPHTRTLKNCWCEGTTAAANHAPGTGGVSHTDPLTGTVLRWGEQHDLRPLHSIPHNQTGEPTWLPAASYLSKYLTKSIGGRNVANPILNGSELDSHIKRLQLAADARVQQRLTKEEYAPAIAELTELLNAELAELAELKKLDTSLDQLLAQPRTIRACTQWANRIRTRTRLDKYGFTNIGTEKFTFSGALVLSVRLADIVNQAEQLVDFLRRKLNAENEHCRISIDSINKDFLSELNRLNDEQKFALRSIPPSNLNFKARAKRLRARNSLGYLGHPRTASRNWGRTMNDEKNDSRGFVLTPLGRDAAAEKQTETLLKHQKLITYTINTRKMEEQRKVRAATVPPSRPLQLDLELV